MVVVEQHIGLALDLCDDVVGLDKGRIVISGPSREVRQSQRLRNMYMASEIVSSSSP